MGDPLLLTAGWVGGIIVGYLFSLSACMSQHMASLLSGIIQTPSRSLAGNEVVKEVSNCMDDKNVPAFTNTLFAIY